MTDRVQIGNVEIVAVLDMVPPPRDPTVFIQDYPRSAWAPYEEEVLEDGMLQLYYGSFFLRSQGQTVLVDTGMGPGPHAHLEGRTGNLLGASRPEAGVAADDVDVVIHTHLHPDHVGWNVDSSGDASKPYFPKARYLAPRKDWEHFTQPEVLPTAPHVSQSVIPLDDLGLVEFHRRRPQRHRRDHHPGDAGPHAGPPGDSRELGRGEGRDRRRPDPQPGADSRAGLVRLRGHQPGGHPPLAQGVHGPRRGRGHDRGGGPLPSRPPPGQNPEARGPPLLAGAVAGGSSVLASPVSA